MRDILTILNAADHWSISSTQLRIMLLVKKGESTSPTLISRHLHLTSAGVTSAVKSLVQRGFIAKQRNPIGKDERGVELALLPAGKKLLHAITRGKTDPIPALNP